MLKIKGISFSYGEKAIFSDYSFNINQGDRICFFGESGCGKTTLLRLIAGLEKPQIGEIKTEKNLDFSYVFQENLLLPTKTVLKNITLFGASDQKAIYNLEALGLKDVATKMPDELSGGMQRRVALARALANDFDILLLDEPFTGLDGENIESAAKHILKVAKHRPIVLVTHSKYEAELFNAKIIYLNKK